jgi:hypothetical protein
MAHQKPPVPIETRVTYVDPNDPQAAEIEAAFDAMFADQADPQPRLAQLLAETRELLPDRLKNDAYWLPAALIFHAVFPKHILTYFRFNSPAQIDIPRFNRKIRGFLSYGEGFLADLAFHLYNDSNRLPRNGLTSLRALDPFHFELAILAIRLAHGD